MAAATEDFDVLVIGAGLSGIGAACHLQTECPGQRVAILEARGASGGTWDLFRYPGVRSDSDMFTLGYSFRPWRGKSIADGPSILRYIRETARDRGIEPTIRYNHRVVHAGWSSTDARWTVDVARSDTQTTEQLTCRFLFCNTGYYRYDAGHAPHFEGAGRFTGRIVHPQHWPDDLECAGRRVVVIGSGATAITLVPALAKEAAHVTMVQRSPSYVLSLPEADPLADLLRRSLPEKAAYVLVRWKNIAITTLLYRVSRRAPTLMARLLRTSVERQLPATFDVTTHFTPRYGPWDQRLCFAPDGDLFAALGTGRASIVTDRIESFTERGLRLASGIELVADVIVTATGLNLELLGGLTLEVDGCPVDLSETVAYKGTMLCGVPNMAITVGYTNASWTLKSDLVARYVCRLLNHMERQGIRQCTPSGPQPGLPTRPFIDLSAGYVRRAVDRLPKQGATRPWRLHQNYPLDVLMLRYGALDDQVVFCGPAPEEPTSTGQPSETARRPSEEGLRR